MCEIIKTRFMQNKLYMKKCSTSLQAPTRDKHYSAVDWGNSRHTNYWSLLLVSHPPYNLLSC